MSKEAELQQQLEAQQGAHGRALSDLRAEVESQQAERRRLLHDLDEQRASTSDAQAKVGTTPCDTGKSVIHRHKPELCDPKFQIFKLLRHDVEPHARRAGAQVASA